MYSTLPVSQIPQVCCNISNAISTIPPSPVLLFSLAIVGQGIDASASWSVANGMKTQLGRVYNAINMVPYHTKRVFTQDRTWTSSAPNACSQSWFWRRRRHRPETWSLCLPIFLALCQLFRHVSQCTQSSSPFRYWLGTARKLSHHYILSCGYPITLFAKSVCSLVLREPPYLLWVYLFLICSFRLHALFWLGQGRQSTWDHIYVSP